MKYLSTLLGLTLLSLNASAYTIEEKKVINLVNKDQNSWSFTCSNKKKNLKGELKITHIYDLERPIYHPFIANNIHDGRAAVYTETRNNKKTQLGLLGVYGNGDYVFQDFYSDNEQKRNMYYELIDKKNNGKTFQLVLNDVNSGKQIIGETMECIEE